MCLQSFSNLQCMCERTSPMTAGKNISIFQSGHMQVM